MRAFTPVAVLAIFSAVQAQDPIISESPLMTAGIIAPPAAPGGANSPPAPGMPNNPAPAAPVATAAAQPAGDPIIDLKALMTAGIIAGSMKLNEAIGIPQPDGSPQPPVNSGALAVAGIVGGQAGAQATSPPTMSATSSLAMNTANPGAPAAAPPLPAGINPATLMTAGILASAQPTSEATVGIPQPAAANPSAIESATLVPAGIVQGNSTSISPTGGVQPAQGGAGNSTVPTTSTAIKNTGGLEMTVWVGCVFAAVFTLI
ncbi:hypothetical protein IFR05_007954 [Cadophora sp. M221]|nr:hypothetical protein IFR05_007954 [Cadophora sp. M221]